MSTVENLLARKKLLLERLQQNPSEQDRTEIDAMLSQIDTALDFLNEAPQAETGGDKKRE